MGLNFMDWMNNALSSTERTRFNEMASDGDGIAEIERIESDASDSTTLATTLIKWLNFFYTDDMDGTRPLYFYLLKSEGIEIAIETIFRNQKLQMELKADNILYNLFQKYLKGTSLIHQRLSDLILSKSHGCNDDFQKYVSAVKKLVNMLKMDYHEVELMKQREDIAEEITHLNGNIDDTNLVQFHLKLKDNFESAYKISQENEEIIMSKLDELDNTLKELSEVAKTCMLGVDAKKKALNDYYKSKCQREIDENISYEDTINNMASQLEVIKDSRDQHQNRLESLLTEVSELRKKISELDELKAQIAKFVLETTELIQNKKQNLSKLQEELRCELADESIQYNISQALERDSNSLSEVVDKVRDFFDMQQNCTKAEGIGSEVERLLKNIMNCRFDNSTKDFNMDRQEFKRELLKEMTRYKKYL